jgi:hypothetical protein
MINLKPKEIADLFVFNRIKNVFGVCVQQIVIGVRLYRYICMLELKQYLEFQSELDMG